MTKRKIVAFNPASLAVAVSVILFLCITISHQVLAHHSYAQFDQSARVTLSGTVKELQWANPHVWVRLKVPTAAGPLAEWGFETFGLSMLKRQGWNRSSLQPGDKVTVEYYAMRDGSTGGQLLLLTKADGTVLHGYDSLYLQNGQ
ncbi:MAG: DUF6152 family protein [Steroidobacteraceae bacterium]